MSKKFTFIYQPNGPADSEMFSVHRCGCADIARSCRQNPDYSAIEVEGATPEEVAIEQLMENYGWDRNEAVENLSAVAIMPCVYKERPTNE